MKYIVDNINNYTEEEVNNFLNKIYTYKKEKIKKIVSNNAKKRSIVSEILLKKLLLEYNINYSLLNFSINNNGKPYIKDNRLFFNISHSNDYVAVAISNYEIGIDIIDKNNKDINYNIIKNIEELCKKEAYTKMLGENLLNTINKDINYNLMDKSNNDYYLYICEKK